MTRRTKVVIVDDDVDRIATLTHLLLAPGRTRHTVVSATSLASAIATVRDFRPDCLVVDDAFGDGAGARSLFAALRAHERPTPAVVLAADAASSAPDAHTILTHDELGTERLVEAIANAVASVPRDLATERTRSEAATTARLEAAFERATYLMTVGKRFAEILDDREAIESVPTLAFPILGDVAVVDLYEASVLYRRSIGIDEVHYPVRIAEQIAGVAPSIDAGEGVPAVLRAMRPAFYDAASLPSVARDDGDVADLRRAGLRSLAVAPLLVGGRCIGTLSFGSRFDDFYEDDLRVVVEEFAQRAGVCIANARVVESARVARDQAETARRRLDFLARVSALFARSLDFEATFRRLTKLCIASLSDTAEIFLVEPGRRNLRRVASSSQSPEIERIVKRLRTKRPTSLDDPSGPGRVATTNRAEIYNDSLGPAIRALDAGPEIAALYREWGVVSAIVAPFAIRGEVAGVVALERDRSRRAFTDEDLALVEDIARRCASYYENARIYEREHSIASTLQHSLLPARLPEVPGLRLASRYVAGADGMDVGGDWYDVVPLEDGRVAVTLGDVVGRGMFAAATMGQLRDTLRAYAFENFAPGRALERLNVMLFRMGGDYFATAVMLVYDPVREEVVYARAGHPPPAIVGSDGTERLLEEVAPNVADDTALLALRVLAPGEERRRTWTRANVDERESVDLRHEALAHARTFVGPGRDLSDFALVIGELLGNIARHAPGPARVSVAVDDDEIVVEVADRGPGLDDTENAPADLDDPLRTSGRGLFLVRTFSSRTEVLRRRRGGTIVRATVPTPAATTRIS